jgi:uroporphyrinogen-III synthase
MRLLLTRATAQAQPWTQALRQRGHVVQELALIEIHPPRDPQPVLRAWRALHTYDAVMFVSASAIDHFFALRPAGMPFTARAFVTGAGSAAALSRCGVQPGQVDVPSAAHGQFDSEALWSVVGAKVVPGYRVLVVRGGALANVRDLGAQAQHPEGDAQHHEGDAQHTEGAAQGAGRDWFAEQARSAGAQVEFVVAYQRGLPVLDEPALNLVREAAHDGTLWLFSSSEAIRNLGLLCPTVRWHAARALATHPRIADAARALGFGSVRESRPALEQVLASIESMP